MVKLGVIDVMRIGRMPRDRQQRVYAGLTIVAFFEAALLILSGGITLVSTHNNSAVCTKVILWPTIAIGLFLLTVLTLGCCCHAKFDEGLFVLLFVLVFILAIVAVLPFVVFGYVAVGGVDYGPVKVREYDLQGYSGWLRGHMANPQHWDTISACLRDKHPCKRMSTRQLVRDPKTGVFVPESTYDERWARRHNSDYAPPVISSIESGCCKPPSSCGFTYVNGTTWTPVPGAPAMETGVDCSRWSNDQQKLCFQCDSCKAGLLDDIKKGWSINVIFLIIALVQYTVLPCLVLSYA